MRILLGAGALALLIALPAAAQTTAPAAPFVSACAALPAPPTLPDGANADRDAMTNGNTAFAAWSETYRVGMACRRAEVEQLNARWLASVAAFNADAATLNTTNTAWEADVAEFNARSPSRRSN